MPKHEERPICAAMLQTLRKRLGGSEASGHDAELLDCLSMEDMAAVLATVEAQGWMEPFKPRERGVVELLCEEIGFRFDKRFETQAILVAFVRELVIQVADMRDMQGRIAHLTGKKPSVESERVLTEVWAMLALTDRKAIIEKSAEVHALAHELNPDEAYPTDHLIDMLSSCVSAVRFGLELPCMSRHAASAASHIWRLVYGVTRSDRFSPAWEKSWARDMFQNALTAQLCNS